MHRAYQPILPCGNKYLQQRWDKATYEEHRRKIQMAKPMVDTSPPATYGHLHLKLGKLKLERDRLSIIERDNRLLLEKMSYIMKTQGRIDNRNDYKIKSLNREKRKQELLRVSQENFAILERITKCKPQYNVQMWNEDWQKTEKYMNSIARYPRGLGKPQEQKFKKKTPKRDRQKCKHLKDECPTEKTEEGDEPICQTKNTNNEHHKETPVENI
ncbi:hypothetical protein lerEdw1_016510 [Lerista edwardsae]|nr:hypothetical protein lerEdw1_016510 [Lerista edwardsae]